MKPEQQVCTLRQACQLKEAGLPQDSFLRWADYGHEDQLLVHEGTVYWARNRVLTVHPSNFRGEFAAFTVAELGMLMRDIGDYQVTSHYNQHCCSWQCSLWKVDTLDHAGKPDALILIADIWRDTEACARAGMLLLIIERKICTVAQINHQAQLA